MSATPLFSVADFASHHGFDTSAGSMAGTFATDVFELMSQLQTTLDISRLLTLFSDHLQGSVQHRGIAFSSLRDTSGEVDQRYSCGRLDGETWRLLLFVGGEELGWLEIYVDELPLPAQQTLADPLISCLIHPLHNALRFEQLRRQSLLDELTGAGSRAAFTRAISQEIARAQRATGGMKLSLMIMDLDCFKQLNDEHGHLTGDRALRRLAEVAQLGLRDADRLFRYGGDEFVALLPDADLAAASAIGDRLETLVYSQCAEPQLQITAGVAQWSPGMSPEALFERADQALYARKREKKAGLRPAR